ncbi:MAG: ComF family protein [Chloroflexi bacterium]|nr:ComF family protein [Chloroflexota bacterium]
MIIAKSLELRAMSLSASIGQAASRVAGAAVDLVYPKRCYVCGRHGHFLCPACVPDLPRLRQPYCGLCAQPEKRMARLCPHCQQHPLDIDGIRSPYLMEGPVRNIVHALKYQGARAVAQPMGDLLAQYYLEERLAADVLVPVPLHAKKERERGYNQSALLAIAASQPLGLPVEAGALRRVRNTHSQARSVSSEERRVNVDKAFEAEAALVEGKRVLVIDDVCTTGATLEACAIALREAGATSVWGLTLAREA